MVRAGWCILPQRQLTDRVIWSCAHMVPLCCFHVKSKEHTAARKHKSDMKQKIKQQCRLVWSVLFTSHAQARCKWQRRQRTAMIYSNFESSKLWFKKGRGHPHLASSPMPWKGRVTLGFFSWSGLNVQPTQPGIVQDANRTHNLRKHLVVSNQHSHSLTRAAWVTL